MNDEASPLFDVYWENSKLSPATMREFAATIDRYAAEEPLRPGQRFAPNEHVLQRPTDRLDKLFRARKSHRRFADRPLSLKQIGSLLSPLAAGDAGRRAQPSAGATYPIDTYALVNHGPSPLNQSACYFNADTHSLTRLGPIPPYEQYRHLFVTEEDAPPAVVLLFVANAPVIAAKYGERGTRFALLEVGQMAQNVSLRVARDGLAGVEIGGYMDDRLAAMAHIRADSSGHAGAIALTFFVGHCA